MEITGTKSHQTRKSIFIVIDEMISPHGTETLAAMLGHGLSRRGYDVHIYTGRYSAKRSAWRDSISRDCISIHHPHYWLLTRYQMPHRVCALMLKRSALKRRPSLVAAVDNCYVCCYALANWQGIDVPFFVHDPSEASSRCPNYVPRWFDVCHHATGLSVHGSRQVQTARDYYRIQKPIEVVHPACFTPLRSTKPSIASTRVRFGLLGRNATMKGTLFAIAALHKVLKYGCKATLSIFGTGPMDAASQELAASLGIEEHVNFYGGYQPSDLDDLVANVDVGIMPSTYEGFGIVLLDFMARGRPVIATDVGSSEEVIGQNGCGRVVPRADTAALADAMLEYCRNPQRIADEGARAQQVWKDSYTIDAMTERYLNFWRTCGANV